jgi:hypothetical protein
MLFEIDPALVVTEAKALGTGKQPVPLLFPLAVGPESQERYR